MRPRWFSLVWLLCLMACLSMLCWAGLWILAERRFQVGLKKAKSDMDAQRFGEAASWLTAQSASRPNHVEVAFLLGVCEDATGRHEAALAAWARVPPESPLGATRRSHALELWSITWAGSQTLKRS